MRGSQVLGEVQEELLSAVLTALGSGSALLVAVVQGAQNRQLWRRRPQLISSLSESWAVASTGRTVIGSWAPPVTLWPADQYVNITLLKKTSYLIWVVDSVTLNSQHYNSCLSEACLAHNSVLKLRNARQHVSTMLRGHFKQRSHQWKAQNCETRAVNRLFMVWEPNQEGRAEPCLTLTGIMCIRGSGFLPLCTCPPRTT